MNVSNLDGYLERAIFTTVAICVDITMKKHIPHMKL
jgi:hypothetical protein